MKGRRWLTVLAMLAACGGRDDDAGSSGPGDGAASSPNMGGSGGSGGSGGGDDDDDDDDEADSTVSGGTGGGDDDDDAVGDCPDPALATLDIVATDEWTPIGGDTPGLPGGAGGSAMLQDCVAYAFLDEGGQSSVYRTESAGQPFEMISDAPADLVANGKNGQYLEVHQRFLFFGEAGGEQHMVHVPLDGGAIGYDPGLVVNEVVSVVDLIWFEGGNAGDATAMHQLHVDDAFGDPPTSFDPYRPNAEVMARFGERLLYHNTDPMPPNGWRVAHLDDDVGDNDVPVEQPISDVLLGFDTHVVAFRDGRLGHLRLNTDKWKLSEVYPDLGTIHAAAGSADGDVILLIGSLAADENIPVVYRFDGMIAGDYTLSMKANAGLPQGETIEHVWTNGTVAMVVAGGSPTQVLGLAL